MRHLPLAAALAATSLPAAGPAAAQIRQDAPGLHEYTLRNAHGVTVRFLNLGGIITAVDTPDREGHLANIVLGYGSTADYRDKITKNGFGALIGRYAGRIAGARFTLAGKEYRLNANDGTNALHGGGNGFDVQRWQVTPFHRPGVDGARLTLVSPDGAQHFPGRLAITVTYRLLADNSFHIDYAVRTTRATYLNVTNHSYFNLAGGGSVGDQRMRIAASRWIEADAAGIPSGRLAPVTGTPLDFTTEQAIGERWDARTPIMAAHGGYNHGWAFDGGVSATPRPRVWLRDPASGRTLTVATTEPSLQAYTGDYIDGQDVDAQGRAIHPRDGIALETQHYSDAPHQPSFPSTLVTPTRPFHSETVWQFGITPRR